ncbi:MAG: hypothetical protein OXC44_05960 [Proteobacteria bacterium]|nr:hypothetical protein [Pseudomonadota bacterium]
MTDVDTATSELNTVKDSYYYLLMGKADEDSSGSFTSYAVYVCHIHKETPPSDPARSKYCVNAFSDRFGKSITIPKAVVEQSTENGSMAEIAEKEALVGKWTENFSFWVPTLVAIVPVVALSTAGILGTMVEPLWIHGWIVNFFLPAAVIGGTYWKFHDTFMKFTPEDNVSTNKIYENLHSDEYRELIDSATVNGRLDYPKLQEALRLYNIENPRSRLQIVVAGRSRHDAGKYFKHLSQSLDLSDQETVHFVNSRIPDLLPLLASMFKKAKWFDEEINRHCLPKKDIHQSNRRMCINIDKKWDTGGYFKYARPTEFQYANPEDLLVD